MLVELRTRKRELGNADVNDVIMIIFENSVVRLAALGWVDLVSV
jgi:hypothetical protein